MTDSVLQVNNLKVSYNGVSVVRDIGFSVDKGEFLGIVGESGCGKSTMLRSIIMLGNGSAKIEGSIRFFGREITDMTNEQLRQLRGAEIAMIPQNAMISMDQTKTISSMFYETVRMHRGHVRRKEIDIEASRLMEKLSLNDPERILKSYPFELSGGMCQRVAIAAAMINGPGLVLGDEPTSALDVTSQLEVVKQLELLKESFRTSLIIVSHNLGLIAQLSDKIAVMYGGKIVEYGKTDEILNNPQHPYTKALMDAVPDMDGNISKGLPGMPPVFTKDMAGCPFYERCPECKEICALKAPKEISITSSHKVGCHNISKLEGVV